MAVRREYLEDRPMRLAAILYDNGAAGDLLLARLSRRWQAQGLRLAGCVQVNTIGDSRCACDMTLRDLSSGTEIGISQRLGEHSRGCRLNPAHLTEAVRLAEVALQNGADLMLLNKFGKIEASGRGFRDVLAQAAALEIPIITGLNKGNLDAWQFFAGDMFALIPPLNLQSCDGWQPHATLLRP